MTGTVLITGAGARIGKVLARGLASDGWKVVIHYNRSTIGARNLINDITSDGGKAVMVQANLTVPQELGKLIEAACEAAGTPLTALINNASTFEPDTAQDFTRANFDHHTNVNLYAPIKLAQDFAAQLPKDKQGAIINLIDQRVFKPNPTYFTYSITKSALLWATQTLAQSLAPKIRVNGIGPGPTLQNTAQTAGDFSHESQTTLLERGSPPETILDAARYLLGAKSVTGQMIAVDGGQHLNWQTPDLIGDDNA